MDTGVPSGRLIGGRCFNEFKTSKSRFCCPAVGKCKYCVLNSYVCRTGICHGRGSAADGAVLRDR